MAINEFPLTFRQTNMTNVIAAIRERTGKQPESRTRDTLATKQDEMKKMIRLGGALVIERYTGEPGSEENIIKTHLTRETGKTR